MFYWFFILTCIELVTANPLTQSIQPCSITSYQTNAYRQPYSDAYIVQPTNNNLYSQPVTVQNPLSYQPLLLSSLKDQIYQIYWDKVLSSPTLKSFLDGNNAFYNQNVREIQTIQSDPPNSCNKGGIVNNYIIVPPESFKINETDNTNEEKTEELLKSFAKTRKKKSNVTPRRKHKQINHTKKDTDLGGIKCYTPAEVLEDRIDIPVGKKEIKSKHNKCTNQKNMVKPKNTRFSKNKKANQHCKSKKIKKKKIKKKSTKSNRIECNEHSGQNVAAKTKPRKKPKHLKQESNNCKCKKRDSTVLPDDDAKKGIPQKCDENIFDLLNLNQDCTNFENRQARNSKNDASVTDFRNIYPDLPRDISNNFAWYMSDFYSNPHLNPNLFPANNMYPYDFSQIYHFPMYSNADMTNKRNDLSKSNKRKKKQKRKKKKNSRNNQNDETTVKTDKNATPKRLKSKKEKLMEPETEIVTSTTTEVPTTATETTTIMPIEKNMSEEVICVVSNEECISLEEHTKSFKESICKSKITQSEEPCRSSEIGIIIENPELEPTVPDEIYETNIPEVINTVNATNDKSELLDDNELEYYEAPYMDLYSYDQYTELGSEDDVPNAFDNRLMEDYYPDFTGDNLRYLSREEIDLHDNHNRYYYLTDKDSRERFYPPDQDETSKESIMSHNDSSEMEAMTNDVDNNQFQDKSEEVVFQTPPGLDFPGFITREVNRDRKDPNEIYYQRSGEDFETIYYDSSADKSSRSYSTDKYMQPNDKSESRVETVYARSKVVKYGQNQSLKPRQGNFADTEDIFENNGGKMVIIAKSLGSDDSW